MKGTRSSCELDNGAFCPNQYNSCVSFRTPSEPDAQSKQNHPSRPSRLFIRFLNSPGCSIPYFIVQRLSRRILILQGLCRPFPLPLEINWVQDRPKIILVGWTICAHITLPPYYPLPASSCPKSQLSRSIMVCETLKIFSIPFDFQFFGSM